MVEWLIRMAPWLAGRCTVHGLRWQFLTHQAVLKDLPPVGGNMAHANFHGAEMWTSVDKEVIPAPDSTCNSSHHLPHLLAAWLRRERHNSC